MDIGYNAFHISSKYSKKNKDKTPTHTINKLFEIDFIISSSIDFYFSCETLHFFAATSNHRQSQNIYF